jgi:hypothetical protein
MRYVMLRRYRRLLAAALACVLAFAGVVTAAHACALVGVPPDAVAAAEPMPDCAEAAPAADPAASTCEAHCVAGQSLEAQSHAPVALATPQPALRIEVVHGPVHATLARANLRPLEAAPPPLVRFARLLN